MHRDYSGIKDLVYNKLDDFRKAHSKEHKEHFWYETDKGNEVSTKTEDIFNNTGYSYQLGKLLNYDTRVSMNVKKRIADQITAEKEQERKQKLSASRSAVENQLAAFLEKYSNVISVNNSPNVREEVFKITCITLDNLNEINQELLICLKNYLTKTDPSGKQLFDVFTTPSNKIKKLSENDRNKIKEEYKDIKNKMKEIIAHCSN